MIKQTVEKMLVDVTNWKMFRVFLESDNGKSRTAHFVKRPDTVMLLARTPDSKFYLINEHCPARNACEYFLPKGKIDPGETPESAAHRELQEEIHFDARKVTSFGLLTNDKMQTNTHLFLMEDLFASPLEGDELDFADLLPISFDEFESMIKRGELTDARSIAAVYRMLKQR